MPTPKKDTPRSTVRLAHTLAGTGHVATSTTPGIRHANAEDESTVADLTDIDELMVDMTPGEIDNMPSMCTVINVTLLMILLASSVVSDHTRHNSPMPEALDPLCNATLVMDVVPRTSMEGSIRLQRWVHQRSVPWRAANFVRPYFHPMDVEKQVTSRLPPLLLQALPQWSCTTSNPELHAMHCTWHACSSARANIRAHAWCVQGWVCVRARVCAWLRTASAARFSWLPLVLERMLSARSRSLAWGGRAGGGSGCRWERKR